MRRRWLAVVVTVIIAGQAMSAVGRADGALELASGRVVDRAGRPVEGATVEVFLWPDEPIPVGGAVPTVLVGSTTSGPDGRYVVTATDPASLVAAAAADGGYVNLELRVRKDRLLFEWFFVLPVASSPGTGEAPARVVAGTSVRGPRVVTRLTPGAPGVGRIAEEAEPTSGGCLIWVKSKELAEQWGVIGEMHRWRDAIPRDTFKYGRSYADSTFEVALKTGTEPWHVSGTFHIGTATGRSTYATVDVDLADPETGYEVEAKFKRAEYSQACTSNKKRQAYEWNGYDIRQADSIIGFDGHCGDTYAQYAHRFEPTQTSWTRDQNEAHWWGVAIDLGVLMAGGRSGYSSYVVSTWTFKDGVYKTLCGNDAEPLYAHRVFAGL
jgi:hypothetical protein